MPVLSQILSYQKYIKNITTISWRSNHKSEINDQHRSIGCGIIRPQSAKMSRLIFPFPDWAGKRFRLPWSRCPSHCHFWRMTIPSRLPVPSAGRKSRIVHCSRNRDPNGSNMIQTSRWRQAYKLQALVRPRLSCTLHLQIGVKRATNCNRKSWEKKLCLEFSCRLSISGQLKGGIYILRPCTSMNSFGAWLSAHSASCQKPKVFSRTERAMLWRNLIQPSSPFQVFSSQPQVLNMARC